MQRGVAHTTRTCPGIEIRQPRRPPRRDFESKYERGRKVSLSELWFARAEMERATGSVASSNTATSNSDNVLLTRDAGEPCIFGWSDFLLGHVESLTL